MTDERKSLPSASSMRRVRLCPGSVPLIRSLVESGRVSLDAGSKDASEGTMRHSLIEIEADAETLDGNTAYTVGRAQSLLEDAKVAAGINGCDTQVFKETRYWLYGDDMKPVCSAKLDHAEVLPSAAIGLVADYKTLYGDHGHAASSEQIATQVVVFSESHGLEECYAALIQPNLAKERQLTVTRYGRPEIARARAEIMAWCAEAEKPDAPRIPGRSQCKNCPARAHCPEAVAAESAIVVLENAVDTLTVAQLEKALDRLDQVYAVAKAIEERAKKLIEADPQAFGGRYALKPGSNKRTITDANGAFAVAAKFGVTVEEYRSALSCGLGALEKLVVAKSDMKAVEAKKELEAALKSAGVLSVSQNKPSLVRAE